MYTYMHIYYYTKQIIYIYLKIYVLHVYIYIVKNIYTVKINQGIIINCIIHESNLKITYCSTKISRFHCKHKVDDELSVMNPQL